MGCVGEGVTDKFVRAVGHMRNLLGGLGLTMGLLPHRVNTYGPGASLQPIMDFCCKLIFQSTCIFKKHQEGQ
jgi:hypothetical protein